MSERLIGVVGAGNMGSGIAQKTATEGFRVVMADLDAAAAARGHERIRALLAEGVQRRIFTEDAARKIGDRVHPSGDLADLKDADVVVEAVFEDLDVKRSLFSRLDSICGERTILATNTSSFTVDDVAGATRRADRVVGLHYFYHPAKNRLVEVIRGSGTSDETFHRAWAFAEATGKTPIRSADSPGFVVNRFFVPWINEAVRLLEEGVADIATIEAAAKAAFRIGMGPFELMNVTGVPIGLHAATTLGERLGPFYAPSPRLAEQVEAGENWPLSGEPDEGRFEAVRRRLLGVTFLVAAALVEEGVSSIEDTDIGARVGLRWSLGPFELANRVGPQEAAAMASELAASWEMEVPALLAARSKPFEFRLVGLEKEGGIAQVILNRPDALNALNEAVVDQLATAFDAADADPEVRTIVLRGTGKAFVAGADIRYFVKNIEADRVDAIRAFTERAQALFGRIDASRKLVICRLDGLSLGGGSELALCADVILATDKGSLGFPETGIGIYPGLGGTQRTSRRVGVPLTRWLVLTGSPVAAQVAASIGLVDEVVPVERMDARIHELHEAGKAPERVRPAVPAALETVARFFGEADVEALLGGSAAAGADDERVAKEAGKVRHKAPIATRIADRLIREGAQRELAEGLAMELSHLDEIFRTKDAYEGLSSLGRKRPEFVDA